jgi:hypothetical protein
MKSHSYSQLILNHSAKTYIKDNLFTKQCLKSWSQHIAENWYLLLTLYKTQLKLSWCKTCKLETDKGKQRKYFKYRHRQWLSGILVQRIIIHPFVNYCNKFKASIQKRKQLTEEKPTECQKIFANYSYNKV